MVSSKTLNFVSIESQCFSMFPSAPPPFVLSCDNQIQNGLGNQIFLPTGLLRAPLYLPSFRSIHAIRRREQDNPLIWSWCFNNFLSWLFPKIQSQRQTSTLPRFYFTNDWYLKQTVLDSNIKRLKWFQFNSSHCGYFAFNSRIFTQI